MGKSDLVPQTPPKKRVRPISNPLYSDDETFFCSIIKHHHMRPGEQFPALSRLCSVSFEHETEFYRECQAFYTFTLEFMSSEEPKEFTDDAPSPCQVVDRPKSYRKPAKYDINPLPPIDESTESIEEKPEHAGPPLPFHTTAVYDFGHGQYGHLSSMASSLPPTVPPSLGSLWPGSTMPAIPSSSPMLQMIQDLGDSPSSISTTKSFDKILNNSETPIAKANEIESSVRDEAEVISIHSISTDPLTEELDRILLTSRFPNLIYDAQSDKYIKKPTPEMKGGSRFSVDLQFDGVYTIEDGVNGEKGKAVGRMVIRPEPAIVKYTNSDGATGVRPLRMKPQIQASSLYRDVKNGLGNEDEEAVVKGHMRTASEPARTPRADQQSGRSRSDTVPIKRISRHPYANVSRKLADSPTLDRQNFRRRKAGPIYLPSYNENEDTSPRKPFAPVDTRSPSPRILSGRSPPPTDRPYRHISQQSINGMIPLVDSPSTHDRESVEGNPSPVVVDITSFVPPPATIKAPDTPESPIRDLSYTLNLPQIFSSPSPIAPPARLPSATPAAPATATNSNISRPTISEQQIATANSSVYSLYTPESSPHNSTYISPTLSKIPSVPSPPNTPKTSLSRPRTICTTPSTPAQTDTYTHTRHNTNSTPFSSISSASPSSIPPSLNPRISNLSQESIALTEHLVREGIYGGIVYDVAVSTPSPNPNPNPDEPHLTPILTPTQLFRKKKQAARKLRSTLRKREREEKRERKIALRNAKSVEKLKSKSKSKSKNKNKNTRLGNARRALRSKRGHD